MESYIALLRGINVSGQKKIKMDDLRRYLEELDFQDIQTYIQSGNIIFRHKKIPHVNLEELIKDKIREKYNFEVPVLIKTPEEVASILKNIPFENIDYSKLYFTLLNEIPQSTLIDKLKGLNFPPEEFVIHNTSIYFYAPNGYGRAKMNNNFFESKLKVKATTRNWKTMNKLLEITQSI